MVKEKEDGRIQLIRIYKEKGSKKILEKLVLLYKKRLYLKAHKYKNAFESVDDAYGYAVIGLLKGVNKCNLDMPTVLLYIHQCIVGEITNEVGRRRRYNSSTKQLGDDVEGYKSLDETPLDILIDREDMETMLECLDDLERRVIKMKFWGGLPLWMIGRETGLGRQELTGVYHKALDKLKKNLP